MSAVAEIVLRPPRPEEAEALTELAMRSKAVWGYDDDFMARCRPVLTVTPAMLKTSLAAVAEVDSAIAGFYRLGPLKDGDIELDLLFIEPNGIRGGVGRRLWDHAAAAARDAGYRRLLVDSDPFALGFYERMGARRIGESPSTVIPGRNLPRLAYDL